jgi:hypothetical protein
VATGVKPSLALGLFALLSTACIEGIPHPPLGPEAACGSTTTVVIHLDDPIGHNLTHAKVDLDGKTLFDKGHPAGMTTPVQVFSGEIAQGRHLLSFAAEAPKTGRLVSTLAFERGLAPQAVVIETRDNGIGTPPAISARIMSCGRLPP